MNKKIFLIVAGVLILLAAWWLLSVKKAVTPGGPPTAVIQTSSGALRGYDQNGLAVYLGIPYAQPPVGSLRFKPPLPIQPWQDTFDAYAFGAFCPQGYDAVVVDDPKEELNNEDCLTLNVWSPKAAAQAKRAVMVYIHGGGFVAGSSKENLYHGDVIAKNGDVVVVTINYRIGLLGFFDFSTIGGVEYAGSADNGIQDQILALKWVKENIAAFGGDPENITIFGESAGAASELALLGIDNPRDYFNRMIVMSGSPLHTATNTSDIGNLLKKETGISSALVWKYMPTAGLMYIQKQVLDAVGQPLSDLIFSATYGSDYVVKRSPLEAIAAGSTKGIDLMLGNMADELSYWSFYDTATSHMCEQTIQKNLFTNIDPAFESKIQRLYDLYVQNPNRRWKKEGDILLAMGDDYAFRTQALEIATQQTTVARTWYYRVDYPVNLPDQPCQDNRSPHGSELPFVFGKIDEQTGYDFIGKPRDASDEALRKHLQDQMILAWSSFAKTGNPNGGDLPEWPAFDAATQPTMIFSGAPHIENAPFNAEYQAMSEFMKTFSVFDALK